MRDVPGLWRWITSEYRAVLRWANALDDRSAFQGACALFVVVCLLAGPIVAGLGSGRWWIGTLAAGVLWPSFLWLFHDAIDLAEEPANHAADDGLGGPDLPN